MKFSFKFWLITTLIFAVVGSLLMTPAIRTGLLIRAYDGMLWNKIRIVYQPFLSFIYAQIIHQPIGVNREAFHVYITIYTVIYNALLFGSIGTYFYGMVVLCFKLKARLGRRQKDTPLQI